MEQTLKVQPRKMNGKVLIIVLSIASIIIKFIAYLEGIGINLFNLISSYLPSSLLRMNFSFEYFVRLFTSVHSPKMIENFTSSMISSTISVISGILPVVLFLVYIAFFYKKSKATALLPITFGIIAILQVVTIIKITISVIGSIITIFSTGSITLINVIVLIGSYTINVIFGICTIAVVVLLLIGSLKGFVNKPLVIIPCALCIGAHLIVGLGFNLFLIILNVVYLITTFGTYHLANLLSQFCGFTSSFGGILFWGAILIFVAKNYVPEIIPMSDANLASLIKKNPKKAKDILTMRYESGKLSEEDYNARISEIDATVS